VRPEGASGPRAGASGFRLGLRAARADSDHAVADVDHADSFRHVTRGEDEGQTELR
jgi:hypothetical protein